MGNYANIKDAWLKSRALGYLDNYVRNETCDVTSTDTFIAVNEFTTMANLTKAIAENFSDEERERIYATFPKRSMMLLPWELPSQTLAALWNCTCETRRTREVVRSEVAAARAAADARSGEECPFRTRFETLCAVLSLDEVESGVFLIALLENRGYMSWPIGYHSRESLPRVRAQFIAKCLDLEADRVMKAISSRGRLRFHECLDDTFDYNDEHDGFLDGIADEPYAGSFFRHHADKPVAWGVFGETGESHGELMARLVAAGAGDGGTPNILLYGRPGCGRENFARAVAAHAGRECYVVHPAYGHIDHKSALDACNALLDPERTLLVIEDAQDIFCWPKWNVMATFAEMKIPAIWIEDDEAVGKIAPSVRRLFDYSVRLGSASKEERLRMWRDASAGLGFGSLLDDETLARYAEKYDIGAGDVASVLGTVARLRPTREEAAPLVEKLLAQREELEAV